MDVDDFLKKSFGNFKKLKNKENSFIYLEHEKIPDTRILMTSGLSQFRMNVHEKHTGEEYIELFFLLPVYWKEEDLFKQENEWIFTCLLKLKNHIEENNTWIGHGHTFSLKEQEVQFFKSSSLTHFLVSKPIELRELLKPVRVEQKSIQFLALLPIYKNELSYKEARGTFKMEEKLRQYQVTEKMDGYRESVIKSRFARLFRR